jgi:trehalose synthase
MYRMTMSSSTNSGTSRPANASSRRRAIAPIEEVARKAAGVSSVDVRSVDFNRMTDLLGQHQLDEFERRFTAAWGLLHGRTVWNINSTATGGGVAEMLQPLLSYCNGMGLDVRWLVIPGNEHFFEITKRIHNNLHNSAGDGGPLGDHEREIYEASLAHSAIECAETVQPGDFVICHDPQTAGLLPALARRDAHLIWRCHIGHDHPDDHAARAWRLLLPYIEHADACVFSRREYVPEGLDHGACRVIQPSIDPLAAKNQPMSDETIKAILVRAGIIEGPPNHAEATFIREDGTVATIENEADMIHHGRPPRFDTPLIVVVSRWDHLKDPLGVLEAYARHLSDLPAALVLAGPNVSGVADDPEGGQVLAEVEAAWRRLPNPVRRQVHLACLPMKDREENAAIVNALQRHASVVVQKSLYEGFGLTVTEAMWKGRPVVASAVGGIQDQIEHGVSGMLVDDPTDLERFAGCIRSILTDGGLASRLGAAARDRVREQFLFVRHMLEWADLFEHLARDEAPRPAPPPPPTTRFRRPRVG